MSLSLHQFRPRLLDDWRNYSKPRFARDVAAGITVGIVALPLAIAFAIASGLKPEAGLFAAIVGGLLISALGGSSVQIGGPAGAFIVVVFSILDRYGLTNLLICTFMAGVLLFALGLLQLGALVRYIPVSIVIGFTNGIAVLIALSQVKDFLGLQITKLPADFFSLVAVLAKSLSTISLPTVAVSIACLAVLFTWPKLYPVGTPVESRSLRSAARIPGPIVVLVVSTLAVWWFGLPLETIGSRFGDLPRGLPELQAPAFDWMSAKQLFIPTLTLATLGAIESLLCARIADSAATSAPRHDSNQELMAQGMANMAMPFVGGMPVTGTIARTMTNIRAGASSPMAGIVHALVLLLVLIAAAPLAAYVPLAALAAILMYVAWNMGEWSEFARLRQYKPTYRIILLGTFALTVMVDLMVAVEVGLVLACVFFIYRISSLTRVSAVALAQQDVGRKLQAFELYGVLFFGAVTKLQALEDQVHADTRVLILDASQVINLDTTALDALTQLHGTLARRGCTLIFCALQEQPVSLLTRSGFAASLGTNALQPDFESALTHARQLVTVAP
jgi:SulP family sulfate permease